MHGRVATVNDLSGGVTSDGAGGIGGKNPGRAKFAVRCQVFFTGNAMLVKR